jgi:hypothetical protein
MPALDETPDAPEPTTLPTTGASAPAARRPVRALLLVVGGLAAVLAGLFAVARGDWFDALYTGGVGAALAVGGLFWMRRPVGIAVVSPARPRPIREALVVGACAVGAAVLIATQFIGCKGDEPGRAEAAGVFEQGAYRNDYLGFRVRYVDGWQEVTTATRREVPARTRESFDPSGVLLALGRNPTDSPAGGASVIFVAERLSKPHDAVDGRAYLRTTLTRLQQRAEPPRAVTEEPGEMIANRWFDRVSLRRTWEGREIGMTFWAAVWRGYAVLITGTYELPEGLHEIESLLAQASETASK